jgi:hypothetical protein
MTRQLKIELRKKALIFLKKKFFLLHPKRGREIHKRQQRCWQIPAAGIVETGRKTPATSFPGLVQGRRSRDRLWCKDLKGWHPSAG